MRYVPDMIILETDSEFKVTVTQKWYATLHHLNTHAHTKLWIPTPDNVGDNYSRNEVKTKSTVILFCLFYSRIQAASHSRKGLYFPNLGDFFPYLRILLEFIPKF